MNAHQRRKFTRAAPKPGDTIKFMSRFLRRRISGVVRHPDWPEYLYPNLRKVVCGGDGIWLVNIVTMAVRR